VEIGPALAEARTKAGLTVADVSERTRIRRAIISDIERDDYSACGGDFYARGHIRAIAKVVGTDSVRLIDEYDENVAARSAQAPETPPDPTAWPGTQSQPQPRSDRRAETRPQFAMPPGTHPQSAAPPGKDPDTEPQAVGAPDPAATGGASRSSAAEDLLAAAGKMLQAGAEKARRGVARIRQLVPEPSRVEAMRAASAEAARRSSARIRQLRPEQFRGTAMRQAGADLLQGLLRMRTTGRRLSWITGAIVILLAGLIVLIYMLVSGPSPSAGHAAVTPQRTAAGIRPVRTAHPARSARPSAAPSGRPSAGPSAGPSARPSQSAVPVTPVSATAFGPGGAGQGDNPQLAALAIGGRGASGWQTNWYTTARFGGLQSGTGLLLDLGKPVTVSSVRIALGRASGGALELRAGNVPVLADLRPVSPSAGTGGTLTLDPRRPVRARYLLIWFTRLPPDSSGTYQATIYHVSLTGTG
jgi:transcriptional regulator with XRE-family HTH domain